LARSTAYSREVDSARSPRVNELLFTKP
jgi:hypothetical protein